MTDVRRLLDELDSVIERAAYTRVDQETLSHLIGLCRRSATVIRGEKIMLPREAIKIECGKILEQWGRDMQQQAKP